MNEKIEKEELMDEEPIEIGAGFVIKVLAIGFGVVSVVVGLPYIIYILRN